MHWLAAIAVLPVLAAAADAPVTVRPEERAARDADVREPRATREPGTQLLDLIPPLGRGRDWLAGHGVRVRLIYRGELAASPTVGRRAGVVRGMGVLSAGLELDSEGLGLWRGGRALVLFRDTHGMGLSQAFLGAAQCVSNLEAPDVEQLSAAWISQAFFEGALWIKAGKQDANAVFASSEIASSFLHSSGGFVPTIPLASYPDPDWGLVVALRPIEHLALTVGAFQAQPDGGRSLQASFTRLRGPMLISQLDLGLLTFGRPGTFTLGAWWNGDAFPPEQGPPREAHGFYAMLDQWLWQGGTPDAPTGGGVFLSYGSAPVRGSTFRQALAGGFRVVGPLASRPRDVVGLAAYFVELAPTAAPRGELALEFLAALSLSRWLSLKTSLQLVVGTGANAGPPVPVFLERLVLSL